MALWVTNKAESHILRSSLFLHSVRFCWLHQGHAYTPRRLSGHSHCGWMGSWWRNDTALQDSRPFQRAGAKVSELLLQPSNPGSCLDPHKRCSCAQPPTSSARGAAGARPLPGPPRPGASSARGQDCSCWTRGTGGPVPTHVLHQIPPSVCETASGLCFSGSPGTALPGAQP